jgi:hypothetical protein
MLNIAVLSCGRLFTIHQLVLMHLSAVYCIGQYASDSKHLRLPTQAHDVFYQVLSVSLLSGCSVYDASHAYETGLRYD